MPKALAKAPPEQLVKSAVSFDAAKVNACAVHRHAAGLSRKELARRLGTSDQVIWLWESGRVHPSPAYLAKLSEVFDIEASEFLRLLQVFQAV